MRKLEEKDFIEARNHIKRLDQIKKPLALYFDGIGLTFLICMFRTRKRIEYRVCDSVPDINYIMHRKSWLILGWFKGYGYVGPKIQETEPPYWSVRSCFP